MTTPRIVPAREFHRDGFRPERFPGPYDEPGFLEAAAPGNGFYACFGPPGNDCFFPFTGRKIGWKWQLFQVPFCQRFTPFAAQPGGLSPEIWRAWSQWLCNQRWTGTWPFSLPQDCPTEELFFPWAGRSNQLLWPGSRSLDRWTRGRKSGLKKSEGLQVAELNPETFRQHLCSLFSRPAGSLWRPGKKETGALLRLSEHPELGARITRCSVYNGARPLNLILVLEHGDRFHYLFSASSPEGNEKDAMTRFFYHWLSDPSRGNRLFDLEGSSLPGVRSFFESLGAETEPYGIAWGNRNGSGPAL